MDLQEVLKSAAKDKKKLTKFLQKFDTIVPPDLNEIVAEEDAKIVLSAHIVAKP
jgi:hypothetical protein